MDVGPGRDTADPHIAVKDPSGCVFHDGRWHLLHDSPYEIGPGHHGSTGNFADWTQANAAPRTLIDLHDQYHCAPQVFYFTPHRQWYLIYQFVDTKRFPGMQPCFSTTENLSDPHSWTKPEPLLENTQPKAKGIDFCGDLRCREGASFSTRPTTAICGGREAALSDFPHGRSEPQLALEGDIFGQAHTYKLKGRDQYLTMIEAQAPGRRYYKAYLADRLEGPWRGLADTLQKPFAARENIQPAPNQDWAASISHGELLRSGEDERLEVDPAHLRFLFQGVTEEEYRGQKYGGIPWRLGILDLLE